MSAKWAKGTAGPAGDEHHNLIACQPPGFVAEVAGTLSAGGNSTGGERFPGTSADTADTADTMLIAQQVNVGQVHCIHADAIGRTGEAGALSADAEGRMRLRDAGMGVLEDGTSYNLTTGQPHAIAFDCKGTQVQYTEDGTSPTLRSMNHDQSHQNNGSHVAIEVETVVRRLMPEECEPLQGFKPGFTQVPFRNKPAADGPRYKVLGNSMAIPVMEWVGKRIDMVEGIISALTG